VTYVSTEVGTWEGIEGEPRGTHFTAVQLLSDADGAFTGTVTVDAYHTVSEDGQTFVSDDRTSVTIRDAQNNIVDVIRGRSTRDRDPDGRGCAGLSGTERCDRQPGAVARARVRRTAQRRSWMRIRLPAGSRTAQSRTP
jgi:hypothetical protein